MKESITELERKVQAIGKIDEDLIDLDKQVEAAKEKKDRLILARLALTDNKPTTWTDTPKLLVEVEPTDDQFWNVTERLQETMKDAHIAKLWRIQNGALWSYYSFHKDRLASHGVDTNERSVWHGTSALDPSVIYEDRQDGFMMQYSHTGMWGRGIYFAKNSSYSTCYAYKPEHSSISADRPKGNVGEREMFLTKLLCGNEVDLGSDRSLMCPPLDRKTGYRYNSVTGNTGGSQVWIVYENGRAYPDYLVRYYRGIRDPLRTPYGSRKEAQFHQNDV